MDNGFDAAYRSFLQAFPAYSTTSRLDAAAGERLRAARSLAPRVSRLHRRRPVLVASQVRRHQDLLLDRVLGNPHSANPTSTAASSLVDDARDAVLRFFNADPREYGVIFTSNATGALKLVGESYPFEPGGRFLLTFDNHNSVNGIREFARRARRECHLSPGARPAPARRRRGGAHGTRAHGVREALTCSRSPRSRTSAGCSIRSSGSSRAHETGGTCCSTAPRSPRPIASICRRSRRTSCRCRSTRCSGTPPGIGALIFRHDALRGPAPSVVRRRDHHGRVGPGGRLASPRARARRVRRRDGRLPRAAGGDDRARAPRVDRHRDDPRRASWP